MNWDDQLGSLRNFALHILWVEAPVALADIRENRSTSGVNNRRRCCAPRKRRDDDLVAGPQVHFLQNQIQGHGTAVGGDRVFGSHIFRKLLLESRSFRPADNPTGLEGLADRFEFFPVKGWLG